MRLLEKHFEIAIETHDGIARLRELILKLAMQGKLVSQNSSDKPAKTLLEEIVKEKENLSKRKLMKKQSSLAEIKKEEIPYPIPKSWKWIKLENICSLITDGAHHTPNYIDEGVPFLSVKNLSSGKIDFTDTKFISQTEHLELTKRCKPEYNDILLTKIGTTGIAVTIDSDKEFSIFVSVALLKIMSNKVHPKFIENLINSPLVKKYSKDGTEGVGNKNLVLRKIREYIIPLPPLEEQKRIVKKIEQLMLLCDKLEEERNRKNKLQLQINSAAISKLINANNEISFMTAWSFIANKFDSLYTVKQNVTDLKDLILELAIRGKLIKQDDEQFAQAEYEFTKHFKSTVDENEVNSKLKYKNITENEVPFKLPENWVWVRLGNICSKIGSGSTPRGGKNVYQSDGVKFIRSQNVYNSGLIFENVVFIDDFTHKKMTNTKVIPNDLLLNITGGSIGRCALVPKDFTEANVSQHVTIIRLLNDIDHTFIHSFILSPYFQKKIMQVQTGANREGLAKKNMELMLVPLPPYNEQKKIATRIDELFKLCENLDNYIDQSSKKKSQILNAVLAQL